MPTNKYPLQWFDTAINVTFQAEESLSASLTPALCGQITEQARLETQQQKLLLKEKSFELTGKQQRQFLRLYHCSMVLLYEQAGQNSRFWQGKSACIEDSLAALSGCIAEILDTFQTPLLALPARRKVITSPDLKRARQQMLSSLAEIKTALSDALKEPGPVEILSDNFRDLFSGEKRSLTESDLQYQKTLLSSLRQMPISENQEANQQKLLSLLVYFNFNSLEFMSYYIDQIRQESSQKSSFLEQAARLLLLKKQFHQMPKHPAWAFDNRYASLETQIGSWFEEEIRFLRLRQELDHSLTAGATDKHPPEPFKVVCFLSVDQIALLLRSMDALRIFKAKSLNVVMQSIAPFLSTPVKADISWQSLRSKSYAAEDKDRQVAIKTLQAMINWIQEY